MFPWIATITTLRWKFHLASNPSTLPKVDSGALMSFPSDTLQIAQQLLPQSREGVAKIQYFLLYDFGASPVTEISRRFSPCAPSDIYLVPESLAHTYFLAQITLEVQEI